MLANYDGTYFQVITNQILFFFLKIDTELTFQATVVTLYWIQPGLRQVLTVAMDIDEALATVGGYGPWQLCALVVVGCTAMFSIGFQTLAIVFIGESRHKEAYPHISNPFDPIAVQPRGKASPVHS